MTSEEHGRRTLQDNSLTDKQEEILRERAKEDSKLGLVLRAFFEVEQSGEGAPKPLDGYVYVAEAEEGMVKIGKSKYPKDRIRSLSTGSPHDLTLLTKKEVPNSREKEHQLQIKYDDHRVRGEWFEVPESVKQEIINEVEAL